MAKKLNIDVIKLILKDEKGNKKSNIRSITVSDVFANIFEPIFVNAWHLIEKSHNQPNCQDLNFAPNIAFTFKETIRNCTS